MSDKPNIRPYNPEDKPGLLRIFKCNVPAYCAVSEISDFNRHLEDRMEMYLVAVLNGQIIGSGGIKSEEDGRTTGFHLYRMSYHQAK
jgi:hypothetical protein